MNIIITMAGLGRRFRKAGYNCPKYMIEAKGKTLFDWSMDSLIGYNKSVDRYVFVVRAEDHAGVVVFTGFLYSIDATLFIRICSAEFR